MITGTITSIDEGNHARRRGTGNASVRGTAQLLRGATTGGAVVLKSYDLNANGGLTPVADQAETLADQLAARLAATFASQGWIAPSAATSPP